MQILLDLDGWEKIEDIPIYIVDSGCIESELSPPINILVMNKGTVTKNNKIRINFVYLGKRKNGLPVFQWPN